MSNYATKALHVIKTDAEFLRKAVEAGDPKAEILLRIEDIHRAATEALRKAGEI